MSTAQQVVLIVFGALVGSCIGSLMCVVIDRMPLPLDAPNEFGDLYDTRPWREVLGGTSHCDDCGSSIRAIDKIPIVSWLVLRGRCKSCGASIDGFHPVVEALVPAVGVAMGLAVGWGWRLAPLLVVVPVAVAIAVIDLRTMIVPTRLVWPSFGVVVVVSVVAALAASEPRWLLGGAVGAVSLAGPLFVIWFALPRGMGFGDVRLAVLMGWIVGFVGIDGGWTTAMLLCLFALGLGAFLGLVLGIVGLAARGRSAKVPFGPAIVTAALICAALAPQLLRPYVA